MKSNKIVSDIKKVGAVATAVLTLNACGNKQLSESQMQIAQHKTDSALAVHTEYKMAKSSIELCEIKINKYRAANKELIQSYARDYIKNNVKDAALARFMLCAIDNESILFSVEDVDAENDTVSVNTFNTMRYVRRTKRWFNDMMLYLKDKYTEQQLLNTDFFKVMNSSELEREFRYNTSRIEQVTSCMKFPLKRKNTIQSETFKKYAKEVQRQK